MFNRRAIMPAAREIHVVKHRSRLFSKLPWILQRKSSRKNCGKNPGWFRRTVSTDSSATATTRQQIECLFADTSTRDIPRLRYWLFEGSGAAMSLCSYRVCGGCNDDNARQVARETELWQNGSIGGYSKRKVQATGTTAIDEGLSTGKDKSTDTDAAADTSAIRSGNRRFEQCWQRTIGTISTALISWRKWGQVDFGIRYATFSCIGRQPAMSLHSRAISQTIIYWNSWNNWISGQLMCRFKMTNIWPRKSTWLNTLIISSWWPAIAATGTTRLSSCRSVQREITPFATTASTITCQRDCLAKARYGDNRVFSASHQQTNVKAACQHRCCSALWRRMCGKRMRMPCWKTVVSTRNSVFSAVPAPISSWTSRPSLCNPP